ncbi:MAG TPA: DUF3568 family protein [Longimicrobiales bacterium]|nr:DUF3568 family protein [Longimicrobiales bacterium]
MNTKRPRFSVLSALLVVPALAACGSSTATTAVGAGAAAAAAIAYNDRGATSNLDASVGDIANATTEAFTALGITLTERKTEDDGIEVQGTEGEWKYVVDIERDSGDTLSEVEVTVSKDVADYSQDRAEELLRAIMQRL